METKRAILWCAVSSEEQADAEKASLPDQERTLRAAAGRAGYDVIEVLTVPGLSRRFFTWDEFTRAANAEQIDAPARMSAHWQARDFDAVFVRDGSRFGRSQSLFAYFVERTVLDADAAVITLQDGEIGAHNYRMFISMGGYAAAADVDGLVRKATIGKKRRAERGIPFGSHDPFTHKVERDSFGRPVRVVLDESKCRLWDDFLEVLCGDADHPPSVWRLVERELYQRFGHTDKFGKPYPTHKFNKLVFTPAFHGHTAFNISASASVRKNNHWLYDESIPVPPGVVLYRNTIDPVYTGEQAERFYAEMRRRQLSVGRRSPAKTYAFSGLLACGECGGAFLVYAIFPEYHYYGCWNRRWATASERHTPCANKHTIRNNRIEKWMNDYLSMVIASGAIDPFPTVTQIAPPSRIEALEREITECESVLRGLVLQIATAPNSVQAILIEQRDQQGERLVILRRTYHEMTQQSDRYSSAAADRIAALNSLKSTGLDRFWSLSTVEQNKMLHALLGGKKLAVLNGEIVGAVE